MEFEAECFGSDDTARRKAVNHLIKSRGKEGAADLLFHVCKRIYALENP